ncbi:2-oxoacid:acceptor oxidoreductase subunit alpha [Desulfocapsa sp. AH-315-G09]|nr:2-oxoacid:acceptor oxidoreductase subunit alpha [Desulfocapsa sp.]MBN4065139.1 2-oxoacid:acceptor oxidoreductase subunit alpha [Desulfocapsa sp. AH-315-G09]
MQFIGSLLAKCFSEAGFYTFTHQDYMSRIKGGHNFYQIRIANHPVASSRNTIDILLALNQETIEIHAQDLNEDGLILYDRTAVEQHYSQPEFIQIPCSDIITGLDLNQVMTSSVAAGAILGSVGLETLLDFTRIIPGFIPVASEGVVASQTSAAQAGLDFVLQNVDSKKRFMPIELTEQNKKRLLMNGNQAIGMGALLSGCKFYSAYPMTPATSIMLYLISKAEKHGVIVEQAEDEISAINMALGASYAGVRAMTGTSGGGFALMTEGISLAGITETPVVIAEVQRPGPATGLPTRTEQSDLFFVIFGGHGEFPKVVFTPGTPEQALLLTNRAFHLAEKYQIPVIIQSDQYLADSQWVVDDIDNQLLNYEDFRLRGEELINTQSYQRYAYSEDGISPLAIPGASKHLVVFDSDEHDQDGHIIEDAKTRNMMVEKRYHKKLPLIQQEIAPPSLYGSEKPDIILTGYGSTFGVLKEAVERLADQHSIAMLHFSEVYPFPLTNDFDYVGMLNKAKLTLCVENNASGQFAQLMRMETGFEFNARINKFDGRPFGLDYLLGEINDYLR